MVDNLDHSNLGFPTKEAAEAVASFARAYVQTWGDLDLASFPSTLDTPLHYDGGMPLRTCRPSVRP